MAPFIRLNNVWFCYMQEESEQSWIIQNLSLSIERGEYISIIGPNGSGKSTLARLLNGLYLPTKGEIIVDGQSTTETENVWEIRKKVGMVFQNPENQIVAPTVEDDVAFGLENLGLPREKMLDRVTEMLELVGLLEYRKQEPARLSGGQKQRLAIAGVVAMKPEVLVLDEVTSMLDPEGRKSVRSLIKELHEEGTTILHITHSAEEAFAADRIIVMDQGQIAMDRDRKDMYKEAETLLNMGLDVPFEVKLLQRLKDVGTPFRELQYSDDMVEEICRLLSKT